PMSRSCTSLCLYMRTFGNRCRRSTRARLTVARSLWVNKTGTYPELETIVGGMAASVSVPRTALSSLAEAKRGPLRSAETSFWELNGPEREARCDEGEGPSPPIMETVSVTPGITGYGTPAAPRTGGASRVIWPGEELLLRETRSGSAAD